MTHLLIAGHGKQKNGGFDPGATGLISKGEHRYVKEDLFPAMKKFLPKNHNLVFFDEYNVYSYGNIVSLAKKYNADQITEFHFDAAGSTAKGGHVIIHSSYSPDKMDLALRDTIKSMVGTIYTHKGHAGVSGRNNLANVNRTANAGITYRLVELGFGTNKDNAKVLTEDVETYAKKLVKTLTGTTNDKKPSTSKPKPSKPKPSTSAKPYTQDAKYPKLQNKGANVGKWQRKLKKLGYYTGKIDNSFGPSTDKATRAFQKANGLAVDGQAGPASNKKADSLIKSKGKITVPNKNLYLTSPQMQGTAVRQLQEALASIHFYPNKGAKNNGIDGYYGPKTADAVKRFQSVNGLKADGSFGPATRKKLKQKV